jgi:hypothetical protein
MIIVVSPSHEADSRQAYSTRGQLFDGTVEAEWS